MRTLLTGAAGRLGQVACQILHDAGHEVVAVDQKYRRDLPVRIELHDLRDELAAYRLAEGCEAVVHLANHPTQYSQPMPQQVLTDNIRATVNVFRAAQDVGVTRLVFASSIQAILGWDPPSGDPPPLPYLPLDGSVPSNPRDNLYALSKEWGERLLQLIAAGHRELSCTSLRFPVLLSERRYRWALEHRSRSYHATNIDLAEALSYLTFSDAGDLICAVLDRQEPGYHCYLPAQTKQVEGLNTAELLDKYYPNVELRAPLEQMTSLVDISALKRDLGWQPKSERICVNFGDRPAGE